MKKELNNLLESNSSAGFLKLISEKLTDKSSKVVSEAKKSLHKKRVLDEDLKDRDLTDKEIYALQILDKEGAVFPYTKGWSYEIRDSLMQLGYVKKGPAGIILTPFGKSQLSQLDLNDTKVDQNTVDPDLYLEHVAKLLKEKMPNTNVFDLGVADWMSNLAKLLDKIDQNFTNKYVDKINELIKSRPTANKVSKKCDAKWADLANMQLRVVSKFANWATRKDEGFDMMSMYLSDGADHMKLACLIYSGQIQKATIFIDGLDTPSREEIPNKVFDAINDYFDREE